MAKPVVLYHLNQLLLGIFLAGDGMELHGCKDSSCEEKPLSISPQRGEENWKIYAEIKSKNIKYQKKYCISKLPTLNSLSLSDRVIQAGFGDGLG